MMKRRSATPSPSAKRERSASVPPADLLHLQARALEAAENAIVITDREGTIQWVNPAFERITGYTALETIGKTPRILKSGAHEAEYYAQMWSTITAGRVWKNEIVNKRKDGTLYTELETITPVRDRDGTITNFISVKQDITERKAAEEDLKLFRALVDRLSDAVEIVDPATGRYIDVNERALTDLGYTRDELLTMTVADIDPAVAIEEFDRSGGAFQQRGTIVRESVHRRKDGTTFPVEVAIRYVKLDHEYLVTVVRDISERRRIEQAVRDSEERFRLLAESSLAGMYLIQHDRFVYVNKALAAMFGYTVEEIIGKLGPADLVHPEDRELVAGNIRKRLEHELEAMQYEFRGVRKDGSDIVVEVYGSRIEYLGVPGIIGTLVEITARRKAEVELRRKHRALATISDSNQVLVRASDEQSLLQEICRVCVEVGGYRMAWVGYAEQDTEKTIRPVAQCGANHGYLDALNLTWAETERGRGPTGTAIRSGSPSVSRNILNDPAFKPWRKAAVERGYASSVALPLQSSLGTLGALNIYASDPDAFDDAEMELLTELASDLAYGIASLRTRAEHSRMEASLQASELRLRAIIDSEPECVKIVSADGHLLEMNPAGLDMVEATEAADVIGVEVGRLIHPDDREAFAALHRRACSGETGVLEFRIIGLKGTERWVEARSTPLRHVDGSIGSVLSVTRDITERKRMEQALHENEVRYRNISEMISDYAYGFIVQEDGSLKREWLIGSFEKITGYEADEMEAAGGWAALIHPEDIAAARSRHERMLQGHEDTREFRIIRKDGTVRWLRDIARPEWDDAAGRVVRIVGAAEDVTEHRMAAEEIQRSHERYERFFMEDLTGDFISTPEGRLIACNPAFVRMFRFSSMQDAVRTSILKLYRSPHERERLISRLLREKKLEDVELELQTTDGVPMFAIANLIGRFDEEGRMNEIQGYLFDNTRRRTLEESLRQAQKLESIGTLASGIAHDFNNILGIVLGHAALLERDMGKQSPSVQAIQQATHRGAGLVKQLLMFARKAESVIEPVRVNDIVKEIVALLRETFPKSISVVAELEPALPILAADTTQLHQVVLNLCVNARDAMPKGGTLTIRTKRKAGKEVQLRHLDARQPEYVMISVADDGEGMDKRVIEKVFEPFFTTKEKGKGTGLGLSVLHGIVQSHGGFVDVESSEGKGTIFRVFLPVMEVSAEREVEAIPAVTDASGGSETILVVEDEDQLRQMLRTLLELKGYRVIEAKDGKEAVERFMADRQHIQLVVSDMGLPLMGGEEVLRHIRQTDPAVPVILTSGYVEPSAKADLMKLGALDFMQKPYALGDLLGKIREAMAGRGEEGLRDRR